MALGSPADGAINQLFTTTILLRPRRAPEGSRRARTLTLAECRERFRWRVVYPAIGIILAIPMMTIVFGGLGAVARGELAEEWREIADVVLVSSVAMTVLMAAFFPIWLREYRVRVGDCDGRLLTVELEPEGIRVSEGGRDVLAGRWPAISVTRIAPHRYRSAGPGQQWTLDALTLQDGDGRALAFSTFLLDDGPTVFRYVIQRLIDCGRLRRVAAG